jgi:hypothetical protein
MSVEATEKRVGSRVKSLSDMSYSMAILISRAAALLFVAGLVLWPLASSGRLSIPALLFAAPLAVAAIEPRNLGPRIGKAVIMLGGLIAFMDYDPLAGMRFSLGGLLNGLPFFLLGLALSLPEFF